MTSKIIQPYPKPQWVGIGEEAANRLILGQAAQIGSHPLFRSTRTEELGLQGRHSKEVNCKFRSTMSFSRLKAELSPKGQTVQPGVNSSMTCSWFHCGFTLSPSDAVWNSASSCPLMRHALVAPGRNQGKT